MSEKAINYHTPVFICSHVYRDEKPVLLVCKADGDWQMLCGGEHEEGEKPLVAGIGHLLDKDPSLTELLDLPDEWEAERESINHPWIRTKYEEGQY